MICRLQLYGAYRVHPTPGHTTSIHVYCCSVHLLIWSFSCLCEPQKLRPSTRQPFPSIITTNYLCCDSGVLVLLVLSRAWPLATFLAFVMTVIWTRSTRRDDNLAESTRLLSLAVLRCVAGAGDAVCCSRANLAAVVVYLRVNEAHLSFFIFRVFLLGCHGVYGHIVVFSSFFC